MSKVNIYPSSFRPLHLHIEPATKLVNISANAISDNGLEPVPANNKTLQLFIWGEIGGWYGTYGQDIYLALQEQDITHIEVYISSGGGGVLQAFEIYDLLAGHPAHVTAYIFSLAASSATIVASAADKVVMSKQALYMIHEGANYLAGYYQVKELLKEADVLSKFNNRIIDVYQRRTGLPENEVRELMALETWFESPEALLANFIDEEVDFIQIPFQNTGMSRPEYEDIFFSHTAAAFRQNLAPRGYAPIAASAVASYGKKVSNSLINKNSNTMKFSAKLASILALAGLKIFQGEKEVSQEELPALLESVKNEESQTLEQQVLPEAVANSISNTVAEAVAAIRADLKTEVETELQETLELLTTKVSEVAKGLQGVNLEIEAILKEGAQEPAAAAATEAAAKKVEEVETKLSSLNARIEKMTTGKSGGARPKDSSTANPVTDGKPTAQQQAFSEGSYLWSAVVRDNAISADAISSLEQEVARERAQAQA